MLQVNDNKASGNWTVIIADSDMLKRENPVLACDPSSSDKSIIIFGGYSSDHDVESIGCVLQPGTSSLESTAFSNINDDEGMVVGVQRFT